MTCAFILPKTKRFKRTFIMESGHLAYKMFRLQVDSPTLKSIRLHDLRCFAYTEVDSPTTEYRGVK